MGRLEIGSEATTSAKHCIWTANAIHLQGNCLCPTGAALDANIQGSQVQGAHNEISSPENTPKSGMIALIALDLI